MISASVAGLVAELTAKDQAARPRSAALQGQPADAVLGQLRHAGLRPRLTRVPDGHLRPGTVISVQPAGQVPVGTAVTVTAAAAPPGHGHGRGNGGGNGGGNGD